MCGYVGVRIRLLYVETEIEIIMDAMREWEDKTCIRFKSRTTEDSYIHFFKGFG